MNALSRQLSFSARLRAADRAERALNDYRQALSGQLSSLAADVRLVHPAVIVGLGFIAGLLLGRATVPTNGQLWSVMGSALTRFFRQI